MQWLMTMASSSWLLSFNGQLALAMKAVMYQYAYNGWLAVCLLNAA